MKIEIKAFALCVAVTPLLFVTGCTKAPEPVATPAGPPAMRSDDAKVLNDPNVPESIKQQIRGSSPKK